MTTQTGSPERELLTVAQTAARLGVTPRTVSRYAVKGVLTRLYTPTNGHIPRYDAAQVEKVRLARVGFEP